MFQTDQNVFYVQYLFRKLCSLWHNVKDLTELDGPQMTIMQRTRIACWVTKATDTRRVCNSGCCSMAIMVSRRLLNFAFIRTSPILFTFIGRWYDIRQPTVVSKSMQGQNCVVSNSVGLNEGHREFLNEYKKVLCWELFRLFGNQHPVGC
jgi:hypothetical protein